MRKLIRRLKEPSTYAGLAGLALLLGITTETFDMYANAAAGLFGFAAILMGEPGPDDEA